MQSRRDQVQAQTYVLGRVTGALVAGEPEAPENPQRRLVVGLTTGVLVAALGLGIAAVLGFLVPGGATAWRTPGALVLEKDTGVRYVYAGGKLRPVLNQASARLVLGAAPKLVTVSSSSLRGVPHGAPVGIVGAPDSLPPPSGLAGAQWTACAAASGTTLAVGPRPPAVATGDAAVLARLGTDQYLIWHGRRHKVTAAWLPKVLGLGPGVAVHADWLDLVPAGTDVGPVDVAGRATPGPVVDGRPSTVGQLFVARLQGSPDRYFLLERDGLSPLSATGYAVAAADPATARAYAGAPVGAVALSPAAVAALPVSSVPADPPGLPANPPAAAPTGDGRVPCVAQVAGAVPSLVLAAAGTDPVAVAGDTGGLVRTGTALYLVTDAGVKYPVDSADDAKRLGYDAPAAVAVPRELLDLLPTGVPLDSAQLTG